MAEVVLDHVSKGYARDRPLAVRDLCLRVRDGEFIILVGPSGCGKTTTLRLIAGLEQLTSGDIVIDGQNVNRVRPRERNIAMVFQDYALYPHMTAQQNMAFGLKMRKTPRQEIDRRVNCAAEILGISDLLQRKPGVLSGGQRQRVALGRAIVRIPGAKCLLFDEPLSNLDAHMRAAMRSELRSLHGRLRMTSIYVTHDQEEAMTLGQRIVVIAEGAVQQDGPPLVVYHRPLNRFVAGFIGSPAMNFIEGTLVRESGAIVFVEKGHGGVRLPMPADSAAGIPAASDSEVVLGVRPEALTLVRQAETDVGGTMRASVYFTEFTGDQMNVHARTAVGSAIVARVNAREALNEGDTATLRVDPASLHLFAPGAFGARLW